MSEVFTLVWSDEFDQEGSIKPDNWNFDLGKGLHGWGNNESQIYTDSLENCRVEGGKLRITGRKEPDGSYTSARINTYGIQSWKYGRFEIRMKLPQGAGTWPAFWMLSDSMKEGVNWPLCGEIDIMEHVGRNPETIHFSLHSGRYNHNQKNQPSGVHPLPGILDDFHTYTMEWEEEGFRFSVDNKLLSTFQKGEKSGDKEWPYDQHYYLILNLALGGYWGGEIDDSRLPASFEIDSVRVYQKK